MLWHLADSVSSSSFLLMSIEKYLSYCRSRTVATAVRHTFTIFTNIVSFTWLSCTFCSVASLSSKTFPKKSVFVVSTHSGFARYTLVVSKTPFTMVILLCGWLALLETCRTSSPRDLTAVCQSDRGHASRLLMSEGRHTRQFLSVGSAQSDCSAQAITSQTAPVTRTPCSSEMRGTSIRFFT